MSRPTFGEIVVSRVLPKGERVETTFTSAPEPGYLIFAPSRWRPCVLPTRAPPRIAVAAQLRGWSLLCALRRHKQWPADNARWGYRAPFFHMPQAAGWLRQTVLTNCKPYPAPD